ncbi:uncharacterized protein LOC129230325 [Uloborus diversus]|uniref:uncharacterized protein LOC129230325 n=1 Tax=Uloborus diversus TaxID=327109 RepID=UPI00240A683B|nr:uncharacterized protein LOC129230325 [Uloborus diversus]
MAGWGRKGPKGLRLMALEVPQLVVSGEETTLTCVFDLEEDTLYSIKWYRDDLEFFRYVPSDKPPNQFFPLQGLDIDLGRSSNGTVYIQDVDVSTAGTYKCEISADAPSFQTVSAEKMLTVTDNFISNYLLECCELISVDRVVYKGLAAAAAC